MSRVIRASELERGLPSLLRQLQGTLVDDKPVEGQGDMECGPFASTGSGDASTGDIGDGQACTPTLFDQGRAEGYETGYAAGVDAARAEFKQAVTAELAEHRSKVTRLASSLEALASTARRTMQQSRRSAREEAIELATLMAERILQHQIDSEPDLLVELMDELLRSEESPTLLEVRVAPADRAQVVALIDPLCKYAPEGTMPRVLGDPDVSEGFMLVTDRGGIDARITTQVHKLGTQLKRGFLDEDPS